MIESNHLDVSALCSFLGASYGLSAESIERLPGGMINEAYRVRAAGNDYVLKRYATTTTAERTRYTCTVQHEAGAGGLPVPAVVQTRDGDLISGADGQIYTLQEFVRGQQYPFGESPQSVAISMGRMLGRLLLFFARYPVEEAALLPTPSEIHDRLEGLLATAERHERASEVDAIACELLRHKLRELTAWRGPIAEPAAQLVHGDYHLANVMFEGNEVVCVLDFDNVRTRNRCYEVMRAIGYSFREGTSDVLEFFKGVAEEGKIGAEEAASFPRTWHYMNLWRVWPIDVRYEEPSSYDARWDLFIRKPSSWLHDNLDYLAGQFHRLSLSVEARR